MNSDCVPRTTLQLSFVNHIFEWLQLGPCTRIVETTKRWFEILFVENLINVYKLLENHLSELLWVFSGKWQFGCPLKLLPSSAKRSKPSIDWNQSVHYLIYYRVLLFLCKTCNILFTGIWFATRLMIFHHKTFRYNMSNWRHLFY
jgi:hypothetical protein